MGQSLKKALSAFLSLALVLELVPSVAIAESLEDLAETPAAVEVIDEELAVVDEEPAVVEVSDEEPGSTGEEGDEATTEEEVPAQQEDEPAQTETPADETEPTAEPDQEAEPEADPEPIEATDDTQDEAALATEDDEVELTAEKLHDEDPFYFKDVETGQTVTTLHTTGTYELVKKDGTPFTDLSTTHFEYMGNDPRGNGRYSLNVKYVDVDGDDETDVYYLEDFTDGYGNPEWQLPSGTYKIYTGPNYDRTYFNQRYKVVNDGLFDPKFDLSDNPSFYYQGYAEFHAKPYTEGKSDHDYDQRDWHYVSGDSGDAVYEWITPDQNPFVLSSDTRISFWIDTAISLTEDNKPQLESIGLWKADESLETLVGTYDEATDESVYGAYSELYRSRISRVPEILGEAGFSTVPSWPNYLNFTDDSKITTLWERGDGDLNERIELDAYDVANGTCTSLDVIIDHANFASVVAEDGVYFPIVTMTLNGETYTYAYHPITVSAEETSSRNDPRVTTTSLADGHVGDEYAVTLKAKSGAIQAGDFSWAVTDGELPAGLTLDAATGTISGTPTTVGERAFTVTLTETIDGVARTASRDFALNVREAVTPDSAFERLSLGEIGYTPGTIWVSNDYFSTTYLELTIPISLDVRDARYNLQQTELWYMLKMETKWSNKPCYYVWHDVAADLISDDGTMLNVPAVVEQGLLSEPTALTRIRAFLIPKTNDGEYAFNPGTLVDDGVDSEGNPYPILPLEVTLSEQYGAEPSDAYIDENGSLIESQSYYYMSSNGYTTGGWYGDFAHYVDTPQMPYTALENPNITFGSWVRFPSITFEGGYGSWPVTSGRIRLWAYDGTATPTNQQIKEIEGNPYQPGDYGYYANTGTATFKLAPGTYAFVVEGEVPVYDENGVDTGGVAYVDISDTVTGAQAIPNTTPQQFIFSIGPGEGSDTDPIQMEMTFDGSRIAEADAHTLEARFELEDGTYAEEHDALPTGRVTYQTAWYRRTGADASSDVLVATGEYVMFGPSDYDLYVEVIPTGRAASFWKSSGRVKVSELNKTITVNVPRKPLFRGTFTLSCESGRVPADGDAWGILEIQTPLATGGYMSSSVWAYSSTVTVPDLTSGSIVTFTPSVSLEAGSVSYTVREDAAGYFTAALVAPMPTGMISFDNLYFTDVDGTTAPFVLNDGATEVQVNRVITYGNGDRSTTKVPFYLYSGTRLALQPELYYNNYYLNHEATYEITVTHRDTGAPTRLGVNAADYAAKQVFEVTLSPDQTSATIGAATLVSRGYAVVPLENPDIRACTLLLYDGAGKLVDKDGSATAAEVRTPFLDAGDYTLYAVDSNRYRQSSFSTIESLNNELGEQYADRASSISFTVGDGAVTSADALVYPDWEATEIIDRTNSSVQVSASYSDKVSITMHAELRKGVQLTDDAYLEIATNQPSNNWGQGYMSPKALNLNGHALTLNRWENLFAQTQCMGDGSLKILLSEAKKQGAACGTFPLDMTLVIPRTQMAYTEASVWLVTNQGKTRTLIGTARQESHEISLVAPATVAWDTFYVYGETGPNADVTVYLDGMRAATSTADDYGYYTAEVTLPPNLLDYTDFTVQALSQWTTAAGEAQSATSETANVIYTTTIPVVERITMCYQSSGPEDLYYPVVTYYRGKMPDKYLTIYRSEHDNDTGEDAEHAKYFWLIEFANGDDVCDVTVDVPRSASTTILATTDVLKTAESWIDDVKTGIQYSSPAVLGGTIAAKSAAGQAVRDAFESDEVHAYVTKPYYFTSSPDEINVSFDLDGDIELTLPMGVASDTGRFEGYASTDFTAQELADLVDTMGAMGNVRVCSSEDVASMGTGVVEWSSLSSADTLSQGLKSANPGSVDEWLLIGSEVVEPENAEDNSILKVHHQVSTTDLSADEIQSQVSAVINEAHLVIDPFEAWLYDDGARPSGADEVYKGNYVVHAVSTRTTEDESYLHYILTIDDADNVQIETLMVFSIEGSDAFTYVLRRQDKYGMTTTSWDQKNGQRVDVSYTLASDQVESGVCHLYDVYLLWDLVIDALTGAAVNAGNALNEASLDALSVNDEDALTALGAAGEVTGFYGGAARDASISWGIKRLFGIEKVDGNTIAERREARNWEKWENIERVSNNGSQAKDFKKDVKVAAHGVANPVIDGAVTAATNIPGGPAKAAVGAVLTPGLAGKFQSNVTEMWDTVADGVGNWNKTRKYRKYRNYAWRRLKGKMLPGDEDYWNEIRYKDPAFANECSRRFKKESKAWLKKQAKQNKSTHDPSGIVYEAVLSNPIEGATVRLYTYNPTAATAGLDPAQFVDSTQFGIEENPQVTGADGHYQWFVPEGFWQVRVTKKGYETFSTGDWGHEEERPVYEAVYNEELGGDEYLPVLDDQGNPVMETVWVGDYGIDGTKDFDGDGVDDATSYWMPVLPVQLDVNIPLVSYESPKIATVEAGKDGVTVTFSKYMKLDSVTADLFAIGGVAPSAFDATDAEAAGDGSGEILARTFKLAYPAGMEPAVGDNNYTVTFNDEQGVATSYAGVVVDEYDRTAELTCSVHVDPISLSKATVSSIAAKAYTGSAIKPAPTVKVGGVTLKRGTDYTLSYKNNTKVGTATITIKGIGNYTGSKSVTFKINKAALSKATVTVKAQTYTGSALKPAPTVKVGTRTLKSGTDYTVSYKNNTKVGTATVTVKGKGSYTGTKSVTFKIAKASVAKATVSKVANMKYDGTAKKPSPTVKVGGRTLKKGTDYTLSYKNNTKPGTATVTITGKGGYTGTKSVTFKIAAMAGTWKGSGSKWWYEWKDGTFPKGVFLDISGKTYYFDKNGYCVYGWQKIGGKQYYFESSGAMAKSKWVGNYYLKADGTMAVNEWVDGGKYHVDKNGKYDKSR